MNNAAVKPPQLIFGGELVHKPIEDNGLGQFKTDFRGGTATQGLALCAKMRKPRQGKTSPEGGKSENLFHKHRSRLDGCASAPSGDGSGDRQTRLENSASFRYLGYPAGGAEEDRTPDLVIANDALSQLSYSPVQRIGLLSAAAVSCQGCAAAEMPVGRSCASPTRRNAALAAFSYSGYMSATIGDRHDRPHSDHCHGA